MKKIKEKKKLVHKKPISIKRKKVWEASQNQRSNSPRIPFKWAGPCIIDGGVGLCAHLRRERVPNRKCSNFVQSPTSAWLFERNTQGVAYLMPACVKWMPRRPRVMRVVPAHFRFSAVSFGALLQLFFDFFWFMCFWFFPCRFFCCAPAAFFFQFFVVGFSSSFFMLFLCSAGAVFWVYYVMVYVLLFYFWWLFLFFFYPFYFCFLCFLQFKRHGEK